MVTTVALLHDVPIDNLPEGSKVVGTSVLIIELVGMLPYVEGEQWGESLLDWVGGIWFLCDYEVAVLVC